MWMIKIVAIPRRQSSQDTGPLLGQPCDIVNRHVSVFHHAL